MSPAKTSPSNTAASSADVLGRVASLQSEGATGELHFGSGDARATAYFMLGQVVSCTGPADDHRLLDLLVVRGAPPARVKSVQDGLGDDDLADALVSEGIVDAQAMQAARSDLFWDNFCAALITAGPLDFAAQDAVFPPHLHLGHDNESLVGDLTAWLDHVDPVLEALGDDEMTWIATGNTPDGVPVSTWEALRIPRPASRILELLGPPRRSALRNLADWIGEGGVVPHEEGSEDQLGASVSEDVTDDEFDGIPASDYERAARGDFIKSYEVLDKVDLSGVDVIGAEGAEAPPSEVAIEAFADEEIAAHGADESDDEFFGSGTGDFAVFEGSEEADPPPIHIDDDDDVEEIQIGADESLDAAFEADVGVVEDGLEDAGASAEVALLEDTWSGTFTREQVAEFGDRIDTFNNIFRIIFRTFAQHIGDAETYQRFNALVSSGQRQYPELFRDIQVDDDGSLSNAPVIRNLAACATDDYASLLHQGLYELIFSHLFDAKDVLPPDDETSMMEAIVVFERQLNQA